MGHRGEHTQGGLCSPCGGQGSSAAQLSTPCPRGPPAIPSVLRPQKPWPWPSPGLLTKGLSLSTCLPSGGAGSAWSPPRPGLGVSVPQPRQAGDTRSADGFRDVRRPVCGLSGDHSVLSCIRTGALPGLPICLLAALLLVSCKNPFHHSPIKVVPRCLSSLWAEKQAPQTGRLKQHTFIPTVWGLDDQDQGSSRAGSSEAPLLGL